MATLAHTGQVATSIELELIPCPLCGSGHFQHAFTRADNGEVVRCSECGLLYLNPRPAEPWIAGFYDQSYFTAGGHGSGYHDYLGTDLAALGKGTHSAFVAMDLLERHICPREKLLLDVGCGSGALLHVAQQRGYRVRGLEISPQMVEQARKAFGVDVREGRLEDANFLDEEFDVITALEVLEHLADPVGWLLEMRRVLKPDGWLLLTTPNGGCSDKYKNEWVGFTKSFEHLTFFDLHALRRAFETAGLQVVEAWTRGDAVVPGPSIKSQLVSATKTIARGALAVVPPLRRSAHGWRLRATLAPFGENPVGHSLWVLAQRP